MYRCSVLSVQGAVLVTGAIVTENEQPLTHNQRCDQCGARACTEVMIARPRVEVEGGVLLAGHTVLLFCAHDYIKNAVSLAAKAVTIVRHPVG